MAGYHPDRSQVSEDRFAEFIRSPVTGDLLEVPGIGPASKTCFAAHGIHTTFQLIAKYLSFKDIDVGSFEHVDRFYYWLCSTHIQAVRRAGVVRCIASKVNTMMPGIYDDDTDNYDEF